MAILNLTKENFAQEVLQSDKTVLVDFYADWCGPCKMQGPVLEELANDRDDVKVCKLNIDEQRDLAIEYGVMSIPTLMIVKGGEVTSDLMPAELPLLPLQLLQQQPLLPSPLLPFRSF